MATREVTVIDYGVGNLLSVTRALEHVGLTVKMATTASQIAGAERLLLPGVGAFGNAMQELKSRGLPEEILRHAATGRPLLGICLGMQLLLDWSQEFGQHQGLGLVAGGVEPIPDRDTSGESQKVPHIGWSALIPPEHGRWDAKVLHGIMPGDEVYFVHSFRSCPAGPAHRISDCLYGGHRIAAMVGHDNILGCQFHPEKSGETGLKILAKFLE